MDLEQKYKEETGFSVGKIHEIGTTYYSDDYVKWLEKAIDYIPCCETLRDEKAPTIEINLNTKESAYKRCTEITKVLKAPCKIYLYDGEKYIELKP